MMYKSYIRLYLDKSKVEETPFPWEIEFRGAFSKYMYDKYRRWEEKEIYRLYKKKKASNLNDKFALLYEYYDCNCAIFLSFAGQNNYTFKFKSKCGKDKKDTELFLERTMFLPRVLIQKYFWWRQKNV